MRDYSLCLLLVTGIQIRLNKRLIPERAVIVTDLLNRGDMADATLLDWLRYLFEGLIPTIDLLPTRGLQERIEG